MQKQLMLDTQENYRRELECAQMAREERNARDLIRIEAMEGEIENE